MGLSQSDIQLIAAFVRKITKLPSSGAVISETFEIVKLIGNVKEARIVYSSGPSLWAEWRTSGSTAEMRSHHEWLVPEKKRVTALFDPENNHFGYISVDKCNEKARLTLAILAPNVWSALMSQSVGKSVPKAAISEAKLVRATFRARDEERRHIARELHDDLGQSLASLKLALKWTEDLIRKKPGMSAAVDELASARSDVGVMLDKIRDLSHTLYPRILATLGLVTSVKELAHQVARHSQIRTECETRGKVRPLGKEIEIALYRCCQEAINNAMRHSEAAKLVILIRFAQREVRVTVEDDGKGFDPQAMSDSGFWTIRQRMADLGAAFRVSTAKGQGTVVEMIVPYSLRKANVRKNKTTHRG